MRKFHYVVVDVPLAILIPRKSNASKRKPTTIKYSLGNLPCVSCSRLKSEFRYENSFVQ